ncbi:acyl-CoA dehydrogenase family member 11 isoform X3 [Oncorhynchus tshawytscha]|uniref:acyl-CoA dehydrogenase family member 11 isoform X3 n=1 Tax=Oncorhynchus tshawytscha TaxID=74940 RepID=UPI000D09A72D|nr:acyl-CoA dehydrogenase family member 11 isoform X3 [Oncorhynchus tshawytscha]
MTSSLSDNAGVPTPEDLISIYCRCRWIPSSLPQGVYVRHVLGNASAPNAARFGQSVEPLAQVGLQIAESIGLPPSHRRPWHQRNGMKERANFSRRLLKVNGSSGRCLSVWLLNLTGQQKHCASSWMGVRFIMVVGYRSWTKSEG